MPTSAAKARTQASAAWAICWSACSEVMNVGSTRQHSTPTTPSCSTAERSIPAFEPQRQPVHSSVERHARQPGSVTFDPSAASTSTSAAFGSSLNLQGQQTLNVTGDETLGGTSSFALTIGGFAGIYAAANTVSGTLRSGRLRCASKSNGRSPSVTVQGSEVIGNVGDGTFTQTGGTNTANNGMTLGISPSTTGAYAAAAAARSSRSRKPNPSAVMASESSPSPPEPTA